MEFLENRFSVKRVCKSSDVDYIEAIKIYNETTPVDIKTNTNEITYWLDNTSESSKFELLLFVLYLEGEIIGFAMLSYLKNRRILVHDYLALKDAFRVNVALVVYMSLILNYVNSKGYIVDFYLTEMSHKNDGKEVDKETAFFHKLLCIEGFGFINTLYRTLPLGVDNYESNHDAWIYIKKFGDTMSSINRDTFSNIIKGLYFDYYETWYSAFLSTADMDSFRGVIDVSYKEFEKRLGTYSSFEVVSASKECTIIADKKQERTDGSLPARKKKINKILPLVVVTILIAPILIVFCYNWILGLLNIPISSVNSVIGSVFASVMTLGTAYFMAIKSKL